MTARQKHLLLGALLVVLAAAVWWGVERYPPAYRWQFVEVDVFSDLDMPLLRGYRSVLALVAMPVLAVACLATLVVALRRRSLAAILVAGVTFLAANVGVQGVKHLVRPLPVLSRWEEDLHLSGHIGVAVGTLALLLVVLGPGRRRARAWVRTALAVAAMGILVSGWHSVSEVVASLFMAGGAVVLVLATLARPADRFRALWSPLTVVGLVVTGVAGAIGVRNGGTNRDLAAATAVLVVIGAALVVDGLVAPLLVAAVPPEHRPTASLTLSSRSADEAAEACRLVAAAGGHRRDWLLAVADAADRIGVGAVLAAADRAGYRPAAWLVLRRAVRISGRPVPAEVTGPATPWTWLARSADRIAPPLDSAPDGALVRVLAETADSTPRASLAALAKGATAAWRGAAPVSDPAVTADRTG